VIDVLTAWGIKVREHAESESDDAKIITALRTRGPMPEG
jgi:hypothetical protein